MATSRRAFLRGIAALGGAAGLTGALSRTTPLSGLSADSVDVILQQLRFNREHGTILQSDVWTHDSAKARGEMFVQAI